MSTKTSSEKLREKTLLKHLQKRRKRKIPLLRGIYHNKMLKILVILVCLVNLLYHLNIIKITVEAGSVQTLPENTTTTTTYNFTEPTSPTPLRSIRKFLKTKSTNQSLNKTFLRRSINVNSSFNHQNEIVQNKSEHAIQTTKRKLRRKPLGGRSNHTRTGLGPTRYKGKRRKYTRPNSWLQQQQQQQQRTRQNNTNLYKPKNYTTIRTTASTSISSSSTSSSNQQQRPFMTQQQQQFSYTNRSYQRQHQYQQQSVQIPSSTIRVSSTIDTHHVQPSFDNSSRFYPTTNIKHYIGVNSTSIHDLPFQQQNVVIQGNTDIVVYRNIGPVPCPPGVRLVPHRVLTATPDPRINRQRGKRFLFLQNL